MSVRNGVTSAEGRPLKGVISDRTVVPKTGTRLTSKKISRLLGQVPAPHAR